MGPEEITVEAGLRTLGRAQGTGPIRACSTVCTWDGD